MTVQMSIYISHSEWHGKECPYHLSGLLVPRNSSGAQPYAPRTLKLARILLTILMEARTTFFASNHLQQIPREYDIFGTAQLAYESSSLTQLKENTSRYYNYNISILLK